MLSIEDHRRDSAGLKYVYPVISRRAGGVSIGINLNVNNACNWACVYCQVENLTRGGPPAIDLVLLEEELSGFLHDALFGDFMVSSVPPDARKLVDIAFSGNGEPTSAPEFEDAVSVVAKVMEAFQLLGKLPVRLITNGSLLHRPSVQAAIKQIGKMSGEVWFKIDRADPTATAFVNGIELNMDKVQRNLSLCLSLAPVWVQTCWFATDGRTPSDNELEAYCALLMPLATQISGVHLYGLARPSMQPFAHRLQRLPVSEMERVAEMIKEKTGIRVLVSP